MDPEISAMQSIAEALEGLDDTARKRVLRWAGERFGSRGGESPPPPPAGSDKGAETPRENGREAPEAKEYEDLAALFVAADPQTTAEQLLVGGYWHQVLQGGADVTSQQVNSDLKHLGHKIDNINKVWDQLMDAKPQLAVQLRKSGAARQGRKKYRITKAGITAVEEMIKRERSK